MMLRLVRSEPQIEKAIDRAAVARAIAADIVVVAASGNAGGVDATYPAADPGVISVTQIYNY